MINYDDVDFDIVGKLKKNHPEFPEATHLGKIVSHPDQYDPSVLVAIARSQNRDQYEITSKDFTGNDLWRCYECSTLTKYGMPVYFIMNIQLDSASKYIVESKSLKLYLNSFNMTKSPHDDDTNTIRWFLKTVTSDLNKILETGVRIWSDQLFHDSYSAEEKFVDYKNLADLVDYSLIVSEGYTVNPDVLKKSALRDNKHSKFKFEGFRSNCKITNQPDYATVFIKISTPGGVDPVGLIKYLTSFRNENHFHEECCELIYKHLNEKLTPESLSVTCCYTRRGGIDISPSRSSIEKQHLGFGVTTPFEKQYLFTPERTIYQ